MKKVLVFVIAIMVISAPAFAVNVLVNGDFSAGETGWTRWNSGWGSGFTWDTSYGDGYLTTVQGSFGWYQVVDVLPGETYTVTATWEGNGDLNWVEVILADYDPLTDIVTQLDDGDVWLPTHNSIVAKVDGWGLNGGMPFGPGPITDYLYPEGGGSNQRVAGAAQMIVGLKTGSAGSGTSAIFDNVVVDGPVPEPASMLVLAAGLGGLLIRRRR